MENEIMKNEAGLQLDEKLNVLADLITNEVNQAKSWFASNLNENSICFIQIVRRFLTI